METKNNLLELLWQQKKQAELAELISCNDDTVRFGLALSPGEAEELALCRNESLKRWGRVEFGRGILEPLIRAFCDSPYLYQDNYVEMLEQLQDIFYEFKNETGDRMTDQELLNFMREQLDEVCFGDTGYLEGTCLNRLAGSIRGGCHRYKETGGTGVYGDISEETRWDKDLYMEVLKDLCWR